MSILSDWKNKREVIRSIVASMTGWQAVWRDRQDPYIDPANQGIVRLSSRNIILKGYAIPIKRTDLGKTAVIVAGNVIRPGREISTDMQTERLLTLTLRAESYDLDTEATDVLDQCMSRIERDVYTNQLNAANLSYVGVGNILDLPILTVDDRIVSLAELQIDFNALIVETAEEFDAEDDTATWIEHVSGTGTFTPGNSGGPFEG